MRHLNPELERLEQRVAPGLLDLSIEGDIELGSSLELSAEAEVSVSGELVSSLDVSGEADVSASL